MDYKDNPLVSVAIPTYNRAHYLSALIDCWLAQTYANFELIISDDSSTDDTRNICEEYARKDKRIRYIRQDKNRGVLFCFKFLLQQAQGKYFIWAEDDDLWGGRFLEECVAVFEKNPELIMVFAGMVDVDKDGKRIRDVDPAKYMPLQKSLYRRLKSFLLFRFSDGRNQLLLGLWRRDKIISNPLFGLRIKDDQLPGKKFYWGFENFFVFRNLTRGSIGFVPEVRFLRRSRISEAYRMPRPLIPRLLLSFWGRLQKIFGSPYFYYIMYMIVITNNLSFLEKSKLMMWNFYSMIRLFFARKI